MPYSLIFTGIGLATAGFTGRLIARTSPAIIHLVQQKINSFPISSTFKWKKIGQAWANAKYYRGGFEGKMTKTEAYRILGISSNAPQKAVSAQHKRIMLMNHPDRGGSPYLAAKINEAKDTINKL